MKIWYWFLCFLCFFSQAYTEIKLERFVVEPGSRGGFAIGQYSIKNSESKHIKVQIEVQIGKLSEGIDQQIFEVNIPAKSIKKGVVKILIPEKFEKKETKSREITKSNKRALKPKRRMRNSMKDRRLEFNVLLKQGTRVINREVFYSILLPDNHIQILHSQNINKRENKGILRLKQNDAIPWRKEYLKLNNSISVETKVLGKYPDPKIHYSAWELGRSQIISLENEPTDLFELNALLEWCSKGKLLILQPFLEDRGLFNVLLSFNKGDAYFHKVQEKGFKINKKFLSGVEYYVGKDWETFYDEKGVPLYHQRKWGLGHIVLFNYSLSDLFSEDDGFTEFIETCYPVELNYDLNHTLYSQNTQRWLSKNNGFQVAGKNAVMFFILSFAILALIVVFSPKRILKLELKWSLWVSFILIWTIVAYFLMKGQNTQGLNVINKQIKLRNGDDHTQYGKVFGDISFVSTEKRSLKVSFDHDVDWKLYLNKVFNRSFVNTFDKSIWQNLTLKPGDEVRFSYSSPINDKGESLSCVIGSTIKLKTNAEWGETPSALIIGRRVWSFSKHGNVSLNLKEGVHLKEFIYADHWLSDLAAMSRYKVGSFKREKAWLVLYKHSKAILPFSLSDDLPISHDSLDIYSVQVKIEGVDKIQLNEGMADVYFNSGRMKNNLKATSTIFDGLVFKPSQLMNEQSVVFKLPEYAKNMKINKATLFYDFSSPGKDIEIVATVQGKRSKLISQLKGSLQIGEGDIVENQVVVKIKSKKNSAKLSQNNWSIKHLDIALSGSKP